MRVTSSLITTLLASMLAITSCSTQAAYKVSSELTAPYYTDADNQAKDDKDLQNKLKNLYKTQILGNAIDITAYSGEVLLVGQVPNSSDKARAETIAKQIPYVKLVDNYLTVNANKPVLNSNSSLADKAMARIKSQSDIDAQYVRVNAVDGVVYIMGSNLGNLTALDKAIKGIYAMDGVNQVINLVKPGDKDYTESDVYVD